MEMIPEKNQIKHCLIRSRDSFDEAVVLAKSKLWNGVANRLYYSCYFVIHALLLKENISANSHEKIKEVFYDLFVGKFDFSENGCVTFNTLIDLKYDDEHNDFNKFSEGKIKPLITDVQKFINEVEWLLY